MTRNFKEGSPSTRNISAYLPSTRIILVVNCKAILGQVFYEPQLTWVVKHDL